MGNWLKEHRPTPAMLVAVVALVIAATGVATALPGKNTVDSGDIENGEVKSNDLNRKAKSRWVFVDGQSGNVFNQSGGIDVERIIEGVYRVDFGSSMRNYAITATNNDAGGGIKDNIVSAQRCGDAPGDQEFCSPVANPRFIDVHTVTPAEVHTDTNFTLVATPK
jgi:hypothetical protein